MTAVAQAPGTGSRPAELAMVGRRRVDLAVARHFRATMRNDFLTPRGTPYKWQELSARLSRTVTGNPVPTVVPVRYQWQRLDARTGTPTSAQDWREWTFARGQGFDAVLLHTEVDGGDGNALDAARTNPAFTIEYPELLKAPAVDLLLMLSWDVVTFEMMCAHLITTPELRSVGGSAELQRLGGAWGELQFSTLDAVAMFRNSRTTAQHLGFGRYQGRTSAVYSTQCLDCELDSRIGPVTQQGRSSYWSTVQVDTETGDLLSAEMTEMIVATLTGADGRQVPLQKRRLVRMYLNTDAEAAEAARSAIPAARSAIPATAPTGLVDRAGDQPVEAASADHDPLTEAIRLAGRVADHVRWLTAHMDRFPQGVAEFALMGFQTMVGADPAETYQQVRTLRAGLAAAIDGDAEAEARLQARLPEHRRLLEGLLAFGEAATDETARERLPEVPGAWSYQDEPTQLAVRNHMRTVRGDIAGLLALVERLEGALSR
jgi:hypothetical protein